MAISPQPVVRSTSCFILGWGFRGRRIERRYLRFEQIQDGGHRHVGKISSGDISATGRPVHFMFCSKVRFSGTADLMALFPVRTNPRWRPPPSWKNFKWPYLRNRSSDPLHVWFQGGVFGDGRSNDTIFDSNKFKMAAAAILDNFEWPYLRNGSRSTYIARSSLR